MSAPDSPVGATRTPRVAQMALFPHFTLLGVVFPLQFLTFIDKYLYYLRPAELLPTYATGWLLLALLFSPVSLVLWLLFRIRRGTILVSLWIVGTALAGVLVVGVLIWLQTFGWSARFAGFNELTLAGISLAVGLVACLAPAGRAGLQRLYPVAKYGTVLGALCLLTLTESRWHGVVSAPPPVPGASQAPAARPHVVLVTVDALSAAHMSLYGATRPTTPGLEAFARSATTFDLAYANANFTTTGVVSILTGTRPWTHRALQQQGAPLDVTRVSSLPALLGQAGYRTAYVPTSSFAGAAKNGLGMFFDVRRTDQITLQSLCLDRITAILPYGCAAAELPIFRAVETLWRRARWKLLGERANRDFDPSLATGAALQWLASADKGRPIFLWVHIVPPHDPYAAPPPWLGSFDPSAGARTPEDSSAPTLFLFGSLPPERVSLLEARYDESVAYSDHYVSEFVQRALSLLGDNTLIIVTADHGESFEHGYGMHTGPGLFEPLIHIPLIVRFPGQKQAVRSPAITEQVDIAPTVAELAGVARPPDWEGHSLAGVEPTSHGPVFSMNFEENRARAALTTGSVAVIEGRWKLVRYLGDLHYAAMPRLRDGLYDLSRDPGESVNRMETNPEESRRLGQLIDEQMKRHGGPLP
jgi:arylsulfatase A-like enzyme